MADEYIWHNTSWKELSDWAEYFGYHENVTLTDPTAQDYISLCNLFGVKTLSTPVTIVIIKDKWYIRGPLTVSFDGTVQKLHIKTQKEQDIRVNNCSTYTFTDTEDAIKEFNFTTRLKKEGYGYGNKDGSLDFPLTRTWNSRSEKSIRETGFSIQENREDTEQNVLFPFNGIKQCFIPNYFNSDDGASGSINGAVFDGGVLDPLSYPIGDPLTADFKEYSPGFGFSSDAIINCNGKTLPLEAKKDTSQMWNMCLYPLVLMDETSKKHPNMRIVLKKDKIGKNTIQVFDSYAPITKPIEVDPEKDFLVAYTQEQKPLTFGLSVLNKDGVQCSDGFISPEESCVLWERRPPQKDKNDTYHLFIEPELFLQMDATQNMGKLVTKVFPWTNDDFKESEKEILNQDSTKGILENTWKEINTLGEYFTKFMKLFECIQNNLHSVNKSSSIQTWAKTLLTKNAKGYDSTSLASAKTVSMDRFIVGDKNKRSGYTNSQNILASNCCQNDCCGDVFLDTMARVCIGATSFTIKDKKQWNNPNSYVKYIEHWFGNKKGYWLGGQNEDEVSYQLPSLKTQPWITRPEEGNSSSIEYLKIEQDEKSDWIGTFFNMHTRFYLENFFGHGNESPIQNLDTGSIYEINQNDKWYITLNFNNLKGNVKFKFDEKTFFINIRKKDSLITQRIEDKVIVLWTHKLPDGNLAA